MRKTVCFILCILAIVSIALAAGAEGTAVVPVRLLRPVSSGEITVAVGETIAIGYEIGPEDATDKSLEWTSGDPSVAAVDGEGKVTGVSAGTTIVKAVTKDGSNRTIQATVRVPSLKRDPEPVIVSDPAGQTFKVSYYGNDWDGGIDVSAKGKYFEYSVSADGNEAEVTVLPLRAGTGSITFRDRKDRKSTLTVDVSVTPEAIPFNQYVIFTDVHVKKNEVFLSYTNLSGLNIREIGFRVIPYDKNGDQQYLSRNVGGEDRWASGYELDADGTKKTSWYWGYSYYWLENVDVAVYEMTLSDGTVIRLADNDLYWYSSETNSYREKPERIPANTYPTNDVIMRSNTFSVGYSYITVENDLADHYGYRHSGHYIASIVEGSIAYRAGLKVTDLVYAVDGVELADDPYALDQAKARIVDRGSFTVLVERFGEKEPVELVFERIKNTPDP